MAQAAATNIVTQMANMAVGFQKKFDVKSVYDTILTSVFDTAIQSEFKLPTAHGFKYSALRATVLAVENMGEQYVAASITGGSRHLEDLLANALGAAVQSLMTDIMPKNNEHTEEPKHSKSRRGPITSQGHAQQHMKNDKQGLGIDYAQGVSSAHGESGVHRGLPETPGAWQEKGLKSISSSSNRPVTSTNQVHSQHYTHMDTYHHAVQAANDVLDYVHKIENSVEQLWHTATASQHQAAPLTPTHAAHGGIQSSRVGVHHETLTDEFAHLIYSHQGSWWAKATLATFSKMNSAIASPTGHTMMELLEGAGQMADAMNPFTAVAEYYTHHSLSTGQYVSPTAALEHESIAGLSLFGGEIVSGIGSATSSTGKWAASMWGRGFGGMETAEITPEISTTSRRGYLNTKFGRSGNLQLGISKRGYLHDLEAFDFSTAPNSKIFYSGPANNIKADLYSQMTGKVTIDKVEAGVWLKNQALYKRLGPEMADEVWISASQKYASSATGDVSVFAGGANPNRIYYSVELPILEANPLVGDINYLDQPYFDVKYPLYPGFRN